MSIYTKEQQTVSSALQSKTENWGSINPEFVARMRIQNRFQTGLDIARYTARLCVVIWLSMIKIPLDILNH